MALTTVSCCPLDEPCNGRSLTMVAVGPPPPSPPCSPPSPPPHPTTNNTAATPKAAKIPTRRLPITLPPCLNPLRGLPACTTHVSPNYQRTVRRVLVKAPLRKIITAPASPCQQSDREY